MIVDFLSNGSTIPTFPKSSTTLVESFSASRHRRKKIELLLFKLLVQRFLCFVHRKNTINCFTIFFFHSCSHMFRYVSVSFHFSSKDGLQLKVLGRGHAAAAAEVQSQRLLPPEKQGGENTKKMEKRKLLCSTVGEYEKLSLIISFVILCIFRSSDPLSYT